MNCGHQRGEAAPLPVETELIQQKEASICHFEDIRQRFLLPKDIQNSSKQFFESCGRTLLEEHQLSLKAQASPFRDLTITSSDFVNLHDG